MHPKLATPLDRRGLRVFPTFDHCENVLIERVRMGAVVLPVHMLAEGLQHFAPVPRHVLADAPEIRSYLRVFQRRVHRAEKLLHRLRDLVVTVRRTVPVVDDSVVRWLRHLQSPCEYRVWQFILRDAEAPCLRAER